MEFLASLNNSLLSKLPVAAQEILNALPLSNYSLLLIGGTSSIFLLWWLVNVPEELEKVDLEFYNEGVQGKKEKEIKVKVLNTKKSRRGNKKNKIETTNEIVKEESKTEVNEEVLEGDWEQPKIRKSKSKKED